MARVLLVGAFGQRNPGDDALLDAFIAALGDDDLVVPAEVPALLPRNERLVAIPKLPTRVLRAVVRCDAVVICGGTIFKLLNPATGRPRHGLLANTLTLVRTARALGRPVAIVGVGAATLPDRRSRALARMIAANADMLVVRDRESADLLIAAGVPQPLRVGADAAWTLLDGLDAGPDGLAGLPAGRSAGRLRPEENRPDRTVVVVPSWHAGETSNVPLLAAALTRLVHEGRLARIEIEPWQIGGHNGLDDLAVGRALERALRVAGTPEVSVLPPPKSFRAAAERYRSLDLVIGARFHSLVAAASAGCRFAAVAHEAKLGALARDLGQPSVDFDHGQAATTEAIRGALDGAPPARAAVAERIQTAQVMLSLMRSVVADDHSLDPGVPLRLLRLHPAPLVR